MLRQKRDIPQALPYPPRMAVTDLTLPLDASTLRRLLAAVTQQLATALRQTAGRHDPQLMELLENLERTGVLRGLLVRAQVSVLARVWLLVPALRAELGPRLLATLAVEAALAGKLEKPVEIHPQTLGLPLLGVQVPQVEAVLVDGLQIAGQRVHFAEIHGEERYFPLHPDLPHTRLTLLDANPLPIFHDHPKRRGNTVTLDDRPLTEWLQPLQWSLTQIAQHLPGIFAEMRLFLGAIVPVGFLQEDHQSASYPHALGTLYLTLHPRPMMLLEALIHEFQHNKLHALLQLGPLFHGDEDLRVASPVRPDPRPLRGVLLALHAFLPVAALYQKLVEVQDPVTKEHWFMPRYAQIRQQNHEAWLTVRQHAQWTPLAAGLATELARLDQQLAEP